jgi:hypothetical protein
MFAETSEKQAQLLLAKLNLLMEKKCIRESLVYHNKSLKHEKCFNVVSEKPHPLTKYLLSHSGQ